MVRVLSSSSCCDGGKSWTFIDRFAQTYHECLDDINARKGVCITNTVEPIVCELGKTCYATTHPHLSSMDNT